MLKKKSLLIVAPVVILAVGIMAFFALLGSRPKADGGEVKERIWAVTAEAVVIGDYSPTAKLLGVVRVPKPSQIASALGTKVIAVHVRDGEQIQKGQLLVELDADDAKLQLNQHQATVDEIKAQIESEHLRLSSDRENLAHEQALLALAERERERAQGLQRRDLASRTQLDQAEQALLQQRIAIEKRQHDIANHPNRLKQLRAKLAQTQAQLKLAKLRLKRTKVLSPYDGRVVSVAVGVDQGVGQGHALLTLYNNADLEIKAQLPFRHLPLVQQTIREGHKPSAYGLINNQRIELEFSRLAADIPAGRGGADIFLTVNKENEQLLTGQSLEVFISLSAPRQSAVIPKQAVYGGDTIYKIIDQRLQSLKVDIFGETFDQHGQAQVLISSDKLTPKDRILTTKFTQAINGLLVEETVN